MNDKTTQPCEQAGPLAYEAMRKAHAFCPSELSHLDKMRWMASYFLALYAPPVAAPEAPTSIRKISEQLHEAISRYCPEPQARIALLSAVGRIVDSILPASTGTLAHDRTPGMSPLVPEVAASEQQAQEPTCGMCNDSGIVGYPPDQYEECPDCIKARAATTASASTDALLEAHAAAAIAAHEHGEQAGYYHDLRAAENAIRDACRTTAPSRNAALLEIVDTERKRIAAEYQRRLDEGTCEVGGHVNRQWAHLEGAVKVVQALRAALTQQSAAQAPIRQVQQAGFPSAWCDVSEAEFDTCTSAKRIVYAAQASHAGADTEQDMAFNDGLREAIDAIEAIDDGNAPEYRACQEAIRELVRPAMSAATEQKEKP